MVNKDLQETFEKFKKNNTLKKLVSKVETKGLENLLELRNKQVIEVSNHLSHFDYLGLGYKFLEYNLPYPVFLSGENIDLWFFNRFYRFRNWGAFFIDREKIENSERKERAEYLKKINEKIQNYIFDGKNLFIFPEGGRSYNGGIMDNIKTGAINWILESLNNEKMKGKEIYGVNIAVKYKPKRIEENFFPILKFAKNRKLTRFLYYAADLAAFFSQPFRRPLPEMHINFSCPYKLNDFVHEKFGRKKLKEFIVEDIKRLYREI